MGRSEFSLYDDVGRDNFGKYLIEKFTDYRKLYIALIDWDVRPDFTVIGMRITYKANMDNLNLHQTVNLAIDRGQELLNTMLVMYTTRN